MKKTLWVLLFATLLLPALAQADTTYTYTGNAFNQFSGTDSCSGGIGECSLQGSFTVVNPLAPGLNDSAITPESFSLTDGNTTISNANVDPGSFGLGVTTDASGTITGWVFRADDGLHPPVYGASYTGLSTCVNVLQCGIGYPPVDESYIGVEFVGGAPGQAWVMNDTGTWSESPSDTPEPSSLLLLTTGLFALGILALRERKRSKPAAAMRV